jgi:hypothetical protein
MDQRPGTRLRAFALALSVVFGLAQALPVLHFVLVAHRLCAEHGELLHADTSQEGASPVAEAPADDEGQTHLVASAAETHAHEHCGVVVTSQPHGLQLGSPAGPCSVALQCSTEVGQAGSAHRSIALLAYAPKLAPPAALA